jgi:serine/threonine protein phosphatase PrpC
MTLDYRGEGRTGSYVVTLGKQRRLDSSAGCVQGATSLLEYSAGTTMGSRREVNEDAFAALDDANTFVVVDGCGGASSGASAARLAVECFRQVVREQTAGLQQATSVDSLRMVDPLAVAILRANAAIFHEAKNNRALRGQGAALCAVRAFERWVAIAHVGDSRVGRYRDSALGWLTEDHSLALEMRRSGAPTEQVAEIERDHATVITRAIGLSERLSVDISYHPASPGDLCLLCSDGLSRHVERSRIAAILNEHSRDLAACCNKLLQETEKVGGQDNATVLLFRLRGG